MRQIHEKKGLQAHQPYQHHRPPSKEMRDARQIFANPSVVALTLAARSEESRRSLVRMDMGCGRPLRSAATRLALRESDALSVHAWKHFA
jgi:hypothetical protein